MTKYNHAYDIAFEVVSEKEDGSDITAEMLSKAIALRCLTLMQNNEMLEAVGCPFDTYEMED